MSQSYHETDRNETIRDTALACRVGGIQAVPIREDGSKAPDNPTSKPANDDSVPFYRWGKLKTERMPDHHFEHAFGPQSQRTGIGIVTGYGDNPVLMVEFDDRQVFELARDTAEAVGFDLFAKVFVRGWVDETPGGGVHGYVRCSEIGGNTNLASRPYVDEDGKPKQHPLIETRERGGFAVIAPSHGTVHPSGKPYVSLSGGPGTIPTLTPGELQELYTFLRHFDERPVKESGPATKGEATINGTRPGDDYSAKATEETFRKLLADWEWLFERGGVWYLRRPGKDRGFSATWNHGGHKMLKVFTSSTSLEPEKMYRAFSLLAQLEYGGNYSECAKSLFKDGYGKQKAGPTLDFDDEGTTDDEPSANDAIKATRLSDTLSVGSDHKFYEKTGFVTGAISNFTAWITRDTSEELWPGELVGVLTIEGQRGDEMLPPIDVPASDFASMSWLATSGPVWRRAIPGPGSSTRDKLRACIQTYSQLHGRVIVGHRHRSTGWHDQLFTFHGGAIDGSGRRLDVDSKLDAGYERYSLPDPPAGDELQALARRYLRTFDLAPDTILAPILGAPARAIIAPFLPIDSAIFLYGKTGTFKSELIALALAHFGQTFTRTTIPLNFEGTANSTEAMLYFAKDIVAGIDDYAPGGSRYHVDQLRALLDRILRGIGNASGRGRLNADASAKRSYFPRCLAIISGEEIPSGHSATARAQVVEVQAGAVSPEVLTACQQMARDGVYAKLTAAFIQRIAANWATVNRDIGVLHTNALSRARGTSFTHARTGDAAAGQMVALWYWLDFIASTGAICETDRKILESRMESGLLANARAQGDTLTENDPAQLFETYVRAAVAGGDAHLASRETGGEPAQSARFGWRMRMVSTRDGVMQSAEEKGRRIGWVDLEADALYLQPDAAFAVAQDHGKRMGKTIPITATTLAKRLLDAKKIQSTESGRTKQKIYVAREAQRVWHLKLSDLFPAADLEDLVREPIPFNREEVA